MSTANNNLCSGHCDTCPYISRHYDSNGKLDSFACRLRITGDNSYIILYDVQHGNDNYYELVFEMALADIHRVVGGRLKDWKESDHKGEKWLFRKES